MNKILKPTGGTVTVDGRDISEIRLRELAQHMGYVPTSSEDDFPMTVFDTILLGRTPKQAFGTSKEDYDKWRYHYPEFDRTQKRKKTLSQKLSKIMVETLKDEK